MMNGQHTHADLVLELATIVQNELKAETNLTPTQYRFMTLAGKLQDPTINEISVCMNMTRANGAVLVGQLTKRGLIDAQPHPRDSRAKVVYVTEAGRSLLWEGESVIRSAASSVTSMPNWER